MNADALFIAGDSLTGANMYAYCNGNPVMNVDPTGESALSIIGNLIMLVAPIIHFVIGIIDMLNDTLSMSSNAATQAVLPDLGLELQYQNDELFRIRIPTSGKFLDRSYCLDVATQLINAYGTNKKLFGLTKTQVAAECYVHALLFYMTDFTIELFGKGVGTRASAVVIDLNANDPRQARFTAIWWGMMVLEIMGVA